MKEFIEKIINSFLALLFVIMAISATFYFTSEERGKLVSASILDGVPNADISGVDFVSPKGAAFPVNGVVTIQTVSVDINSGTTVGNVSGADLVNSPITFRSSSTIPCPPGTIFNGNSIILPDDFSAACTVEPYIEGVTTLDPSGELRIEPLSCADLQTSILRGYGAGFEEIDPGDLGEFGVTMNGFNFNDTTPISSIDLNYPITTVDGAQTFQIRLDFVPDISIDSVNGIEGRAEIVANNGSGNFEIKVRDEGEDNEMQTALNFAYVFNHLLGIDSPFIAYQNGTNPYIILLQSRELGEHSDDYVCLVNDAPVTPPCFDGGDEGSSEGAGVLTVPLTLDHEMVQGETALVFAGGSAGELTWISSHPSILEAVSLSEAEQDDDSTVDFVSEVLDDNSGANETITATNGSYNVTGCQDNLNEDEEFVSETCIVEASVPIEFDISSYDYVANVTVDGEVVPVTVQGDTLTGFLEGSGTYSTVGGVSMSLSGTVSGVVSGAVSGQYTGTVIGQITAPVNSSATLAGAGTGTKLVAGGIGTSISVTPASQGTLSELTGDGIDPFTSTVKKEEGDISHVSLLYAKRPGDTILTAIDAQGCIASFDLEVIEQKVILEMVGRHPGDVLDVSDTVQINAFVGGANGEKFDDMNITAATGIEWFSSNEDVATIDGTGLLTALKPGVTNITARFDTGEAEIGTIESLPMQVTVNKITGLRVTFDPLTQELLPAEVVSDAHKSVMIAIHNPEAAGQTLLVEGQQVPIELPAGDYESDIAKVEAIAAALNADITALQNTIPEPIVTVTTVDGFPGLLVLQPVNQDYDSSDDRIEDIDENGIIDISTTALEKDLSILPTYNNAIPLPASETYGLMVIAKYDNGATKLLPPTEFTWVNTPINYLEQASLDSGFIKLGEISGTSTVVANYENADGSVVTSNYLTIKVDSGPVIEYVRRIGSGAVTKGSRIHLQAKVTDVDSISDIAAISTSLVYSNFNTYTQINEDPDAVWFSATPFLSETTVVNQGTTEETTGGETTETTEETALQFKTYDIPVEIPVDQSLFDGIYKLILTITDAANHTINYVYPIRIGEIAGGDVNVPPDGVVNMVDVMIVFQIAAGILPNPTSAQLEAANVDGMGGVTLVDVILLFNKVSH